MPRPWPEGAVTPLRPLAWAAATVAGGALLHIDRVPLWASLVTLLLLAWRLLAGMARVALPAPVVRTAIAAALVAAVAVNFQTLSGLGAGTTLLILMAAVKVLESRRARDEYIAIGAGLFMLLAACLDRQELVRSPLYLAEAWLCCAALAVVGHGAARGESTSDPPLSSGAAARLAARALLLALPLAIALFLLFPRLSGALWSLPRGADARTGLGDTMTPGSIAELSSSYEIAFRVKFLTGPPPAEQRYWRGPVLHEFDGETWSRRADLVFHEPRSEGIGPAYRYRISLEPSEQRWWFALDVPEAPRDGRATLTHDLQLLAESPVRELTIYESTSHTETRTREPLSRVVRRRDTELPANRNPRTLALAAQLRAQTSSDGEFVQAALQWVRGQHFQYTLTPPRLGVNSVDDLLFMTRRGFCGHYASAYATLLRAAGIPARVVTGYLGGEWNAVGDYFIVRQSDAHAWTEAWLAGQGWRRIDPTAVVEPERLRAGLLDLLPNATRSASARLVHSSQWLRAVSARWDAVNTWWSEYVIQFDYRSQLNLLARLGLPQADARLLVWGFVAALTLWLAWIAWHVGWRSSPRRPRDPVALAYGRLTAKLARIGLPRERHLGPLGYLAAVAARRPDLATELEPLFQQYAELRYGGHPDRVHTCAAFERAVARLRLRRA